MLIKAFQLFNISKKLAILEFDIFKYNCDIDSWKRDFPEQFKKYIFFQTEYRNIKPDIVTNTFLILMRLFWIKILASSYTFQQLVRLKDFDDEYKDNLIKLIDMKCIEIFGKSLSELSSIRLFDEKNISFSDKITENLYNDLKNKNLSNQRIISELYSEVLFDLKQFGLFQEKMRMEVYIGKMRIEETIEEIKKEEKFKKMRNEEKIEEIEKMRTEANIENYNKFKEDFIDLRMTQHMYKKFTEVFRHFLSKKNIEYSVSQYQKLEKQYNKIINSEVDKYLEILCEDKTKHKIEIARVKELKSKNLPTPACDVKLSKYKMRYKTTLDRELLSKYKVNLEEKEQIDTKIKINPYTCDCQMFKYDDIEIYLENNRYFDKEFINSLETIKNCDLLDDKSKIEYCLILSGIITRFCYENSIKLGTLDKIFKIKKDLFGNFCLYRKNKQKIKWPLVYTRSENKYIQIEVYINGQKLELNRINNYTMNEIQLEYNYRNINELGQICTIVFGKNIIFDITI